MSAAKFSEESISNMSDDLLRAVIRERTHHTVEYIVYKVLAEEMDVPENFGETVQKLLEAWRERGLSTEKRDLRWVENLLQIGRALSEGKRPERASDQFSPAPKSDKRAVKKAIYERRSIRSWKEKEVPDQLIKEIIHAGLWAPHSCNLQTIRVIVMKGERLSRIFQGGEIGQVKVMLVICQDQRPYEFYSHQIPDYNRFYDCGAAIQNMILMAHTLGLGSVWLTYEREKEEIKKLYNLPDFMEISSFIALGWAEEKPIPPGRMEPEEAIIDDSTFEVIWEVL